MNLALCVELWSTGAFLIQCPERNWCRFKSNGLNKQRKKKIKMLPQPEGGKKTK